ncbi:putative CAF1 family ribonuclease [Talaromyces proteolyticus]|uniref:CAF1 family ribonuclease n=1 Tax=Talaromyces proteolyticus TaxID=1131652 RepID=A0AAD4L279_9EURO|nr:putative CAF1 family ribonuclease [Talaromyces proteolyticus]KAH8705276.1 putative CAF1 family ribonuclease [Talaromyces proteolyticus]
MNLDEWDTVTNYTWSLHLPDILQALSDCSFVAIDFEFSGIASHRNISSRHQTLQERYTDTKEAAEKFQILQVGLTIAHEDTVSGVYTLKPYNIHLSPLIDPILGIDRIFSVSSSGIYASSTQNVFSLILSIKAIQFLLKTGFKMDSPFTLGVPYLTKNEEDQAVQEACKHSSNSRTESIAQMELPKEDVEALTFLANIRKEIDNWVSSAKGVDDYLNVPSRNVKGSHGKPAITSLNRFQKRLVHQLVEKEYPSLTSIGRTDFVRIVKYDQKREEGILQQKLQRVEKRLVSERGFMWIIDALAGGDLSKLEPEVFSHLIPDRGMLGLEKDIGKLAAEKVKSRLREKRAPVVGHNLFTDLVYMWQCFFGDLPERLEDFTRLVHEKFPLLIDTKYIFTHDCGDINPIASLDMMNDAFKNITKPQIVIDSKHTRYQRQEHLHEAGYDSLLTATNFIKQAAQLPGTATRVPGLARTTERKNPKPKIKNQELATVSVAKPADTKRLSQTDLRSRFAHQNLFDTLPDDDSEDSDLANELEAGEESPLIPLFSSPVWKKYGNRLRVFGTDERICTLDCEG